MICKHDPKFIDTGDEGTSHCVYCRCLAAEAIVNRLPRTVDDVPITPGMELWTRAELGNILNGKVYTFIYKNDKWIVIVEGWTAPVNLCYSTKEALVKCF